VIREVNHRPHLLLRITVSDGYFPHRALVPVMRLVHDREVVANAWFTEISNDNRSLHGYFGTRVPRRATIEFGYPDGPLERVPVPLEDEKIKRLDRRRIEEGVVEVTPELLDEQRGD
jgi:hypothetical protein